MAKKKIWNTTSAMCRKAFDKHTLEFWVDRYLIFAEKKEKEGRMPFLGQFLREYHIIVPMCGHNNIEIHSRLQELYRIVSKEYIIMKNIDKATFAAQYLQNEGEWSTDIKTDQSISINLTSFKLPPAIPQKELEATNVVSSVGASPPNDDIIEGEVVEYDELPIVTIAKKVKEEKDTQEVFDINNKLTEMLDNMENE